ncbi:flagellar export protein FliJ [Bacillus sp. B15-48]|uniref:flagellar export protein FliJ n=1 Tax=Bacillus sp. B15-48 TaxID=1548601 RepID=UPI00193F416C|nr:flagellar export protein FliJ [Bacillus sp. B15-48]MBM4764141.1 flagellar export protein FliJ [Bacillus sp. B15-48]
MSFRYQHSNILNLKEKQKDQAYSEYGQTVKKKEGMLEELHTYTQEREERLNVWEQSNRLTSVVEIQQRSQYLQSLNLKIARAQAGLDKVEKALQEKQHDFLEKKKEEQVWLHLRDQSYEMYLQKQKRAEQDRLDEIATIRHYHQQLSRKNSGLMNN